MPCFQDLSVFVAGKKNRLAGLSMPLELDPPDLGLLKVKLPLKYEYDSMISTK